MATFALDIHARYQCRHAGACCQNWAVPAEPEVVAIVEARHLRRRGVAGTLFLPGGPERAAWTVARDERNDCVFFERDAGRLCVIHRDAGIDALPAACRHFPRKVLHDASGSYLSLSHFCPTAARLLLMAGDLRVVAARPPLELPPPVEGLDAVGALPPLVRPGLLCDVAGYRAWEEAGVAAFARPDLTWHQALDVIAAATEVVRDPQSRAIPLLELVPAAFERARAAGDEDSGGHTRALEAVSKLAVSGAGDIKRIEGFDAMWRRHIGERGLRFDRAMKNYLAARLFANWVAYQGRGLRTIVEWLRACAAVLRHTLLVRVMQSGRTPQDDDFVEAVRSTDLLLLHTLDSAAFARHVMSIEGPDRR
jgi:hypothetical protein